jgi:Ig domain of plant-specific actin-binding protein
VQLRMLAGASLVAAVVITATVGGGSAATLAAPQNTTAPSISGTTQERQVLTANPGRWTNSPTSYSYQWLRCDANGNSCGPISGATSTRYTLTAADVGHRLRVTASARNADGTGTATSGATSVVTAAQSTPANTTQPSISGTTQEGQTLTANPGRWTNSPTSYSYQWLRCDANGNNCGAISGATSTRYTLTAADVGHHLRVTITARNARGTATATSASSSLVTAAQTAPANTRAPSISGTPQEGLVLTADRGQWSGTNPITYAYQWQRCDSAGASCADIPGATGQSYTLGVADAAHTIRVRVSATNARGSRAATSNQTDLIAPGKAGGAAISISAISLPNRLVVDRVSFSPRPIRSRRAFVARFHVSDTRGFSVQGALVYALGLPYSWVRNAPEVTTDGSGWATITMQPTAALPLRRGGSIVIFVRARKPGENLLAGVSTRRLVQATTSRP